MKIQYKLNVITIAFSGFLLSGCASKSLLDTEPKELNSSYLGKTTKQDMKSIEVNSLTKGANEKTERFRTIDGYQSTTVSISKAQDFRAELDNNTKEISMVVDNLPVREFVNYVFSDILKLDYVLDDGANSDSFQVSLNVKKKLTELEAFQVAEDILEQRNYVLVEKNKVLYVVSKDATSLNQSVSYGVGKGVKNIPSDGQNILQIVPLENTQSNDYTLLLRSLAGVEVYTSRVSNTIYLKGKYDGIYKALEFIRLTDKPGSQASNIGMIESFFTDVESLSEQLQQILANESISTGVGAIEQNSVGLVPINNKGLIIVFAKNREMLNRVKFWANKLDKPNSEVESGYFIFRPKFARAADLGESLQSIVSVSGLSNGGETVQNNPNKASKSTSSQSKVTGSSLSLTVDERSNSLIVNGSSKEYQKLLPLIKSLDVLPKQVMLEMIVAEVTLQDNFKNGVEYSFSDGKYSLSTEGALGLKDVGGFSYILNGVQGKLSLSLSKDSSLVNVLSRPSIVVRDGVTANITVGTDIPVVGETTSDPLTGQRQTTTIQYRKTGIELDVTPTVNSRGVVIMEIKQKISNSLSGGVQTGGSPSIFERAIKTEVVANSGQTIILGGLISENNTVSETKVPGLADIPLLGKLFEVDGDEYDKTELVVLVTPKIIHHGDEWNGIKSQFFNALDHIEINE